MADLDRRSFLAGAGLAAGLAAGCRARPDPYTPERPALPLPAGARLGAERAVLSTCAMCPVGCGIRVRVVEGRAVKIEGNPDSPVNRGAICARGLAGLEMLYHRDRVPGPLRRRGNRGDGQWEAVTWDDAIGELQDRLTKLQDREAMQRLLVIDGEAQGTTHALWALFMAAFGSPNHIGHAAMGAAAVLETARAMTGQAASPSYDLEHAGCVVLVGTGALESSSQAMALARAMAGEKPPRLICLAPRLPGGAALVDGWIPVLPGGAAKVLLAAVHVLLSEGLVDERAIEGVQGRGAARDLVLLEHSPAQVAEATGVAPVRIEDLAHTLATIRPAVVLVDEETKDSAAVAAALWLNTLLGSMGTPGGMDLERATPSAGLSSAALGRSRHAAVLALDGAAPGPGHFAGSRLLAVPEAVLSGKPYPAEILLLYYSNPMFSKPGGQRWSEAIARIPFVVSFSPIRDESTLYADLLLPDLTYLERWDIVTPGPALASLRQPVVPQVVNGMQTAALLLRLARGLGGAVAKALPWPDLRAAALARLDGLAESDELLDQLMEAGTAALGDPDPGSRSRCRVVDLGPVLAPPDPPAEDSPEYPLLVCPFRDRGHGEGGSRACARLAELPGASSANVELSADDARALGIAHGEWVRVVTPAGQAQLQARIQRSIRPGVIGICPGGWGKLPDDVEGAPARLLVAASAPSTGQWLAWATRARLEKLG